MQTESSRKVHNDLYDKRESTAPWLPSNISSLPAELLSGNTSFAYMCTGTAITSTFSSRGGFSWGGRDYLRLGEANSRSGYFSADREHHKRDETRRPFDSTPTAFGSCCRQTSATFICLSGYFHNVLTSSGRGA